MVRNCQELGISLQKICSRLLNNDNLVKLLYYPGLDPLNQRDLTDEEKKKHIFNELIRMVPLLETREDERSVIVVYIPQAKRLTTNEEFRAVTIAVEVLVPPTQWLIKDSNLRPFAILGAIQESLNGKNINGLGTIEGGDFELINTTKEITNYKQVFRITEYD